MSNDQGRNQNFIVGGAKAALGGAHVNMAQMFARAWEDSLSNLTLFINFLIDFY